MGSTLPGNRGYIVTGMVVYLGKFPLIQVLKGADFISDDLVVPRPNPEDEEATWSLHQFPAFPFVWVSDCGFPKDSEFEPTQS